MFCIRPLARSPLPPLFQVAETTKTPFRAVRGDSEPRQLPRATPPGLGCHFGGIWGLFVTISGPFGDIWDPFVTISAPFCDDYAVLVTFGALL